MYDLTPPSTPGGRGEVGDLEFDAGLRNWDVDERQSQP
jgi:hypothetical protein